MKAPQNKFKSFADFGMEEKTGVPSGIVEIADNAAIFVVNAIAEKGILDSHRTFQKTFSPENPHPEFPVDVISIKITHRVDILTGKEISIEGAFEGDTLRVDKEGKLRFNIQVNTNVDLLTSVTSMTAEDFKKKFTQEMQGLFYHEFLHVYEDYKRTQKDKLNAMFHSKDFLFASVSSMMREQNSNIHPFINKFIFCIYAAASFEVRARVSQVYPFIKDIPNPHEREKVIKQTFQWKLAETLADFNAKEFYTSLVDLLGSEERTNQLLSNIATTLAKGSAMQTRTLIMSRIENEDVTKETATKATDKAEATLKSVQKLAEADPMKFLNFWQKKFNTEGKSALHKLAKLTTI